MEKNICEICKTENEPEYVYCKNCGNALNPSETASSKASDTESQPVNHGNPNPNSTYNSYNYSAPTPNKYFTVDSFDGVSAEEMAIFVGKNGDKILPKFSKMQLTGSKVSWCWPAAVLGYILGPLGSAIWFFYRKMYKPAMILAIIGAVITVITGAMSLGIADVNAEDILNSLSSGDVNGIISALEEAESATTTAEKVLYTLSTLINEITKIAVCIITGIYGMYIYKQHCKDKIIQYKSYNADPRFYQMGLSSIGGHSGGMLALGIVLYFAAETVSTFVNGILNILF